MVSIGQRIRELREGQKLSQEKLSTHFDVSRQAVSMWEINRSSPDAQTIGNLADFFGVTVDYLLGRTDDPHVCHVAISDGDEEEALLPRSAEAYPVSPSVKLPIVGTIRAGMPLLAHQYLLGYESADWDTVRGGEYFWLRVQGDSMIGDCIPDGALVLVRRQPEAMSTDIAVVIINGEEATLKRVRQVNEQIVLTASNAAYLPQVVPAREVHIVGVVVETKIKR